MEIGLNRRDHSQDLRQYADTSTGDRWRNFIAGGRVDWGHSSLLNLSPRGALSSDTYNCPISTKGIVVCNYPNYNGLGSSGPYAGLQEVVLVYSTGHVSRSRVRLDDTNSSITDPGNCLAPPADTVGQCATYAHAVACQELGHAFGLDHAGGDTCMGNGYFASSAFQVHPNGHDYDAIGSSHGHSDGAPSASSQALMAPAVEPRGIGGDKPPTIRRPPKNDCSPKRLTKLITYERVCGPERQHPDEIRVKFVIPPSTPTEP